MDPNLQFDTDNTGVDTLENNIPENNPTMNDVTPRNIDIRESELRAMHGSGWNRKKIAQRYGVTTTEIYQVMVNFGMIKARTTEEELPEYVINPIRDCSWLEA